MSDAISNPSGTPWESNGPLKEFLLRKFVKHHGYVPNLAAPNTFNEKVLHKMLFDRRPILTTLADKLAVRDYAAQELGGTGHLSTIYNVVARADDLRDFAFPPQFVLKANHGCGWNYINHGIEWDRARLVELARQWLQSHYGRRKGEWCYNDIAPRVFCEEYLGIGARLPVDYKFFCFSGIARFILTSFDRQTGLKCNIYDRDWTLLDVLYRDFPRKFAAPVPANLNKMIAVAERLSDGIDFVRVDLYDLGDRVIIGELTNYPGGGTDRFYPLQWDATFGSYWRLPIDLPSP